MKYTSKMFLLGACGVTSVFGSYGQDPLQGNQKPNVIIILTDDQGYGDFSIHGNPILKTPAMDRLYNQSIRFDRFHVAPLCTPTRGQMLTGLDGFNNKAATVLTGRNIMRRDLVTMPEIFALNGYATGIFGKWHLGDTYPNRPMDRGFQKSNWVKGWGLLSEVEYDNDYYETRYLDSLETKFSGEYCTNLWFRKSMEWMEEINRQEKPFFTFLSLNVPHGPFNAQTQDLNMFKDKMEDQRAASFYGMLRNVDRNLDHLETWLHQNGLHKNTIIIYLTDNGSPEAFDIYNAGMRGRKGSNYEGGHRAAFFLRWPAGNLVSARTLDYPAQVQDLLPTLIDLLDLRAAPGYPFDGISLKSLVQEGINPQDRMFVIQYGGHTKPEKYFSCVVWNTWRLVGADELYNLDTDPGQEKNIVADHPEVAQQMRSFYENWWENTEPGINEFVPLIVGSDQENPVILTSDNWEVGAVNTQWAVAQASGPESGGIIHIQVALAGRYRVELSRWPFHLTRVLTSGGPESAVGGTRLNPGKALPIESGCLSFNEQEPLISTGMPGDSTISFDILLPQGESTIRAWFRDKQGKDLCGAYFLRLERLK